ncbi:hypothetical protein ACGFS9_21265 [Streptomyces sp. NPDC048566]|uniref:hypothetical protein n=1 Tax=Streptomyces sp. NPDC048566 TaxID=3365569 RepID=UPI003713BD37
MGSQDQHRETRAERFARLREQDRAAAPAVDRQRHVFTAQHTPGAVAPDADDEQLGGDAA